jgi:26S proteasome regulatory subunit N3
MATATKDVEMKDVDAKEKPQPEKEKEKTPAELEAMLLADLQKHVNKLKVAGDTKDSRNIYRTLRHTFAKLRRKLQPKLLTQLINSNYADQSHKQQLLAYLPKVDDVQSMEIDAKHKELQPEADVYLHLLVLLYLVDNKTAVDRIISCATELVDKLEKWNRRTLDPLSSKVYFYFSRAYELAGRLADIRSKLLAAQRTATLRHNFDGQGTLLTLLLRNYLHYNLYDQAEKLASKTDFREEGASSNELARYYYYQGRIKAVQLNYTEAYEYLQQALRKAPTSAARGFRATAIKLLCIVQLLTGEIPERGTFRQAGLKTVLKPYFELTQAVRRGDLGAFQKVVESSASVFRQDKNFNLVQRLRMSVIKTGLRKISLSYSRISFKDICDKLRLESAVDAEFIVAKAIRDQIIDATINHEGGYLQSRESVDIYASTEPQNAFNARISSCLGIHNEAVKAMRYPPSAYKKDTETEEERIEREKAEEELAKALEDDDVDDEFY